MRRIEEEHGSILVTSPFHVPRRQHATCLGISKHEMELQELRYRICMMCKQNLGHMVKLSTVAFRVSAGLDEKDSGGDERRQAMLAFYSCSYQLDF